jgi:hypothetical protein
VCAPVFAHAYVIIGPWVAEWARNSIDN